MTSAQMLLNPTKTWIWQNFPICYHNQGDTGPCVILVHGFGASAKPQPGEEIAYTFDTWAQQLADFCREVVGEPAFLIGNSIGSIVVMQAVVSYPEIARSIALINCSLRLLHDRKRSGLPWTKRFGTPILQRFLAIKPIGEFFFRQIARPQTVRKILLQAYANQTKVTTELVDLLMAPASHPGAASVFIAFTAYSSGPLPEDLLPLLPCPAMILWGTEDPWEPIDLGRELANFPQVQKFIPLAGVGHCPQDEAPELVNPMIQEWISQLDCFDQPNH